MSNIITEQTVNNVTQLLANTYKEAFGEFPKVIDFGAGVTASGVTQLIADCDGTEIRFTLCDKGLSVTTWFSEPWCMKVLEAKKKSRFTKWKEFRQSLRTLEAVYNDISSIKWLSQA